jgi:phosphoglycerol transferase
LRTALIGIAILGTIAGAFLIANADTLSYWWCYGRNAGAVVRNYEATETYALKPIELLVPNREHLFPFLRGFGLHYYHVAVVRGEKSSAYLGLVGIASLLWLGAHSFLRLSHESRWHRLPRGFWEILWIFLYSAVGGVNCLIALWGMDLFRGTNRYSIVILAIVLLFLARMLGSRTRRWPIAWRLGLASLLLIIGIPEQMSGSRRQPARVTAARVESDRRFAGELEASLPPGSAIFQLPVVRFPEEPPMLKMLDYDHLRLFLFTHTLRFSYGEDKGRGRELWQFDVQKLPAQAAVELLRRKGFAAVVLDRDAYADRGASLMADFEKAGQRLIGTAERGDFTAFSLSPPR